MQTITEASITYLSGLASGVALSLARQALSEGGKRKEAVLSVLALRRRLIECLGNDTAASLDSEMQRLAQWSGYFTPTDRLSLDMSNMQSIHSYARQDSSGWNHERMGERRRCVANYTRDLEEQDRVRGQNWYIGPSPLFRAR